MKTIPKYLFFSIVFVFFSACTEKIDIQLNEGENNRLVVEGGITDEYKIHSIKLTRSADYFYNQLPKAELQAQVRILSDNDTLFFIDGNNDGIYDSERFFAGIPEKNYTLKILLTDGSEYEATTTMKSILPIDSIRCEYAYEFDFEKNDFAYIYKVFLYAQEPPTYGDYYLWDLYIDDEPQTDTLKLKVFTDDMNVNGNYIYNFELFRIKPEKLKNDSATIKVSMQTISKAQYDFILSLLLETVFKGGPFDGPPANVTTNLSNGALGFFYANAITYTQTIVNKPYK
jgi:hypothetical protein